MNADGLPPRVVLRAFRAPDGAVPLAGGEGRSVAAGHLVLKPVDDWVEAAWVAEVMNGVVENGFRVPRPVPAEDGTWVFRGWTAWQRVEGKHERGRWDETIAVCEVFSHALAGIPRPAFLDAREHPWAVADRVAWNEAEVEAHEDVQRPLERLISARRQLDQPAQIIHGDLTENLLFADGVGPAVIDFSPFWRPAGFAAAIIVADAIIWGGADHHLIATVSNIPDIEQLLVRAAIFRLVAYDQIAARLGQADRAEFFAHQRLIDLVC